MRPARFASFLSLLIVAPVHASEAVPSLAGSVGQMLIGLAVVIALLLSSLWLIKRLSAPRGAAAGLRVLGGMSLGSRERVVLLEVDGKVLVLGVTASSVNTLHTMEASALPREALSPAAAPAGEFSKWLRLSLERRKHAD